MADMVLLVDYENIGKVDLAAIPEGVRVPFFFGASQKSVPTDFLKAALKLGERFVPIDIEGQGKNALDFHIAFYLGEQLAQEPESRCVILSKDKGFDPLVKHLVRRGFGVRRVNTVGEALGEAAPAPSAAGRRRGGRRGRGTGRQTAGREPSAPPDTAHHLTGHASSAYPNQSPTPQGPAPRPVGTAGAAGPGQHASSLWDHALGLLAGTQKTRRPRKRKGLISVLHSHFSQRVPESELQQLIDQMIAAGIVTDTNGALTYHL